MNGRMCLMTDPHGGDFPARCVKSLGHEGAHRTADFSSIQGFEFEVEGEVA